jgi:hypothetical protein
VTTSTAADTIDSEEIWLQLRRELEDVGISASVVEDNHTYISNWLKTAISNGMLEEMDPTSRITLESSVDSGYGRSGDGSAYASSDVPINAANEEFEHQLALHPSRVPSENTMSSSKPNVKVRKASSVSTVLFRLFKKDTAIIEAASGGDISTVAKLIGSGANVNARDRWGVSLCCIVFGRY